MSGPLTDLFGILFLFLFFLNPSPGQNDTSRMIPSPLNVVSMATTSSHGGMPHQSSLSKQKKHSR